MGGIDLSPLLSNFSHGGLVLAEFFLSFLSYAAHFDGIRKVS